MDLCCVQYTQEHARLFRLSQSWQSVKQKMSVGQELAEKTLAYWQTAPTRVLVCDTWLPAVFIVCYQRHINSTELDPLMAPCSLKEYFALESFAYFGIIYIYRLLVYIVCFPTYPFFFTFSLVVIFSFENRPAPFPGQRS